MTFRSPYLVNNNTLGHQSPLSYTSNGRQLVDSVWLLRLRATTVDLHSLTAYPVVTAVRSVRIVSDAVVLDSYEKNAQLDHSYSTKTVASRSYSAGYLSQHVEFARSQAPRSK